MAAREGLDPIHLREAIDNISDWLAQATTEARAALNELHTSTTQSNDLAQAFQRVAEDLGVASSLRFVLSVEGAAQELHPIVREEVYRIGCEAIRNACLHSGASELEVRLSYAQNLTMRVRDNGTGIDPDVARNGRPGHFGLRGMQRRAIRIRGTLHILSRPNSGTEIEPIIPGKIVFLERGRSHGRVYDKVRRIFAGRAE